MNATELRELAVSIEAIGDTRSAQGYDSDEACLACAASALRACAEREERAQAGITPEMVEDFLRGMAASANTDWDKDVSEDSKPECRAKVTELLQSAALAVQGGREKLRALHHRMDMDASNPVATDGWQRASAYWADELYSVIGPDDLSRAIGDSNER